RHAVRRDRQTDRFGKAEDRRHVDNNQGELGFQVLDKLSKSPKILVCPRGFDGGARHEVGAGPLFNGDNVILRAATMEKIAQGETKVLAEEARDTGSTQIRIDENDLIAGQRGCPRKGESMGGLPLTGGRGGYAESRARPLS